MLSRTRAYRETSTNTRPRSEGSLCARHHGRRYSTTHAGLGLHPADTAAVHATGVGIRRRRRTLRNVVQQSAAARLNKSQSFPSCHILSHLGFHCSATPLVTVETLVVVSVSMDLLTTTAGSGQGWRGAPFHPQNRAL